MLPTINILGKDIGTYTICALIGLFSTSLICIKEAKKRNIVDDDYIIYLLFLALGIFFGSHLLYAITNFDKIITVIKYFDNITGFNHFIKCMFEIFGGSVFYGGLLGLLFVSYIYGKKKKINHKIYLEILTPGIPLFHAFGRIGCFLGGCCYGIPSKFGLIYTHSLVLEANHVRRLPIQLIESVFCFGLFFLLYYFLKKNKFKNKLLYLYFIIYGTGRFILEFFRGDEIRGFLFGISTSQIISIILIIYAIIRLFLMKKRGDNNEILF